MPQVIVSVSAAAPQKPQWRSISCSAANTSGGRPTAPTSCMRWPSSVRVRTAPACAPASRSSGTRKRASSVSRSLPSARPAVILAKMPATGSVAAPAGLSVMASRIFMDFGLRLTLHRIGGHAIDRNQAQTDVPSVSTRPGGITHKGYVGITRPGY